MVLYLMSDIVQRLHDVLIVLLVPSVLFTKWLVDPYLALFDTLVSALFKALINTLFQALMDTLFDILVNHVVKRCSITSVHFVRIVRLLIKMIDDLFAFSEIINIVHIVSIFLRLVHFLSYNFLLFFLVHNLIE